MQDHHYDVNLKDREFFREQGFVKLSGVATQE